MWSSPCATFIANWCWVSFFVRNKSVYSTCLIIFGDWVHLAWKVLVSQFTVLYKDDRISEAFHCLVRYGGGERVTLGQDHFCIPHTWEKGIHAFTPQQWRPWVTLRRDAVSSGCGMHAWLQNVLRITWLMMLIQFIEHWWDPLILFRKDHIANAAFVLTDYLILQHICRASYNSKVDLNSLSVLLWRRLLTWYFIASMFLTLASNFSVHSQKWKACAVESWKLYWISARQQGSLKSVQLNDPPSPSVQALPY